jgi:hypothetical protein
MRKAALLMLVACGGGSGGAPRDGDTIDGVDIQIDAAPQLLGTVTNVADVTCPMGAPPNATCKSVTVTGCPGIENEPIDATVAVSVPIGTVRGTITHFSGGGGEGFQVQGAMQYAQGGFRQVFVSWATDWEQTTSHGIKTAACRPATIMKWIFDEPTIHAASRSLGFCGEGFSGGSGQLGYALAHFGMGAYLDYVNELSGPPFARIDLGCDGNAPSTAVVCGDTVTMQLPPKVAGWENTPAPGSCGGTTNDPAEIERWKQDSISTGGTYAYPQTPVEFFDCTNNATAVTAMAQLYHDQITSTKQYHCYKQADGCMGEGLGSAGFRDAAMAMIAGCIPRHM